MIGTIFYLVLTLITSLVWRDRNVFDAGSRVTIYYDPAREREEPVIGSIGAVTNGRVSHMSLIYLYTSLIAGPRQTCIH